MRYFTVILFSIIFSIAKSQSDTIVITDEPLIINKEFFYSIAPTPIKMTLLVGTGLSIANGYQNYSSNLNYKNSVNGIALSTELLLSKGKWITSVGLGYNQTAYLQQQKSNKKLIKEQSKTVSDTSLTYDINWKEDVYYPSGGYFDTTYIYTIHTRDSIYTSSKDTTISSTKTCNRKIIELPINVGYQFNSNKTQVIVGATITPFFILNKNEKSFHLLYGGSVSALYEITKQIRIGPKIQAQKVVTSNETASLPRYLYSSKIIFSYNF